MPVVTSSKSSDNIKEEVNGKPTPPTRVASGDNKINKSKSSNYLHSKQDGKSKRPLSSTSRSSIPKALGVQSDTESEEDEESSPVNDSKSTPGGPMNQFIRDIKKDEGRKFKRKCYIYIRDSHENLWWYARICSSYDHDSEKTNLPKFSAESCNKLAQ